MNLYLHYGVGHKPSKTRLNLTQSKTIKYNLQSRTGKYPKKGAVVGIMRRRRWRVYHTSRRRQILCSNRTQIHRTPPRTATEAETWSTRAVQGVTNPLARADHAPVNGEFFGRSKQRQNRRTTAGKATQIIPPTTRTTDVDLELKE
jgi:hypothetical protein